MNIRAGSTSLMARMRVSSIRPKSSLQPFWNFPPRRTPTRIVSCAAGGETVEIDIKVEGMVCDGCSSRVQDALSKMDGVKTVDVNLDTKLAVIEIEAGSNLDALSELPKFLECVKDLGFEAEPFFGNPLGHLESEGQGQ